MARLPLQSTLPVACAAGAASYAEQPPPEPLQPVSLKFDWPM